MKAQIFNYKRNIRFVVEIFKRSTQGDGMRVIAIIN